MAAKATQSSKTIQKRHIAIYEGWQWEQEVGMLFVSVVLCLCQQIQTKSAPQDEPIYDLWRDFKMKIVLAEGVGPIILRPTPAWIACSTVCGAAYPSSWSGTRCKAAPSCTGPGRRGWQWPPLSLLHRCSPAWVRYQRHHCHIVVVSSSCGGLQSQSGSVGKLSQPIKSRRIDLG